MVYAEVDSCKNISKVVSCYELSYVNTEDLLSNLFAIGKLGLSEDMCLHKLAKLLVPVLEGECSHELLRAEACGIEVVGSRHTPKSTATRPSNLLSLVIVVMVGRLSSRRDVLINNLQVIPERQTKQRKTFLKDFWNIMSVELRTKSWKKLFFKLHEVCLFCAKGQRAYGYLKLSLAECCNAFRNVSDSLLGESRIFSSKSY